MSLFNFKSVRVLCASFAFFVVTGDLIADVVHDATDACIAESQGGCDSCPACSGCAFHTATALAQSSTIVIGPGDGPIDFVRENIPNCVVGLPAAIDHPPQLA